MIRAVSNKRGRWSPPSPVYPSDAKPIYGFLNETGRSEAAEASPDIGATSPHSAIRPKSGEKEPK